MIWRDPFVAAVLAFALPSYDRVTTVVDFHQWADDNKIVRAVEISEEPGMGGGKGLIATRDLQPGEVALQVPRTLTIRTTEGGTDWPGVLAARLCELQEEAASELPDKAVTIPFGSQTYTWKPFSWKPYLEYGLPSESPHTASHWTAEELSHLQNQTMIEESLKTASWRDSQYRRFGCDWGRDEFDRALSLVCSRALEGGSDSHLLVPLLDNANHASKEDGGGQFLVGSSSVALFAGKKGVKRGEAVTLDYGKRPADEYAIHYGFIPTPDCLGNSVFIPELEKGVCWSDCEAEDGHPDPSVREHCTDILNKLPTTLEHDQGLLRDYKGGFDAYRVALNYRCAQKSLLKRAAGV